MWKRLFSHSPGGTSGNSDEELPKPKPFGFKDFNPLLMKWLYDNEGTKRKIFFEKMELKTQMNRESLAYIAIGMLSCYVGFGYRRELVSDLIGFCFPFYLTLKLLKAKKRRRRDQRSLLIYWTVFALCQVADDFFGDMLPAYFLFKTVFYVYLMIPSTGGIYYVEKGLLTRLDTYVCGFIDLVCR
ncbi:unnamed protein product [Bursaphelenchus okinawaensis]|uniref:Receptor expression-enhancing protein n=1 Tax=Bursaphelenchus okinawaensis TaxID=465554 RepID=A0A811LD50_9BILA|nr:unnamed protein product [Bursaphelenchus okinawaensis]CAG9120387.1 unnamed protein product [Bursaphelenchus okinawaensis]